MRFQPFLALSLLPQSVAAFGTAPSAPQAAAGGVKTRLRTSLPCDERSRPGSERRVGGLVTSPLPALTELKRGERGGFNRALLMRMGVTVASSLAVLARSNIARAAARPVMPPPGLGIVDVPRPLYQVGRAPIRCAWSFSLALFVTAALLRLAGDGYVRLVRSVSRYFLGDAIKDKEGEADSGMPKQTDRGRLQKKVEERSKYQLDKRTMLFEPIKTELESNDSGMPKQTDWGSYSRSKLHRPQEKVEERSEYQLDKRTMLFEPVKTELVSNDSGMPKQTVWDTYSRSKLNRPQKVEERSNYQLNKRTMLFEPIKTELESNDSGAKQTDWGTYSRSKLDRLQKVEERSKYQLDKRTMLFEPIKTDLESNRDAENAKKRSATEFFQEQQYKQHHHPVHVARSKFENAAYLDTLAINKMEGHDAPRGYLDTLSNARESSWDVYGHKLSEARLASEVDELERDVSNLESLMQIGQSMYQASNEALKLAVEAQSEELYHFSRREELKDFDRRVSTSDELKAFDEKAQEFEETVMKHVEFSKSVEKKSGVV